MRLHVNRPGELGRYNGAEIDLAAKILLRICDSQRLKIVH